MASTGFEPGKSQVDPPGLITDSPSLLPDISSEDEQSGRIKRYGLIAWPGLAVYGASAALHLLVLALMTGPAGHGVRDRLLSWDGHLYTSIATHGYPHSFTYTAEGVLTGNNLAFFPLFPLLSRGVHELSGFDFGLAGVVTAHLAIAAALVAVHQLLTRLHGPRIAAIGIVLLAAAQPMSIAFFMAYSESLFLALCAGALLAAHRKAWLTAGVLAFLAGLTRPAALAITLALAVAAVMYLRAERRFKWRPVAAVILACTATPGYLWWVGHRLHSPTAWFQIQQAGWGTHWDNGESFLDYLRQTLTSGDGWVAVSTAVLILALLCATAIACRRTTWPPLLVYGIAVTALTLGQSNFYHSKLRLLIPALIFLIPVARAIARTGNRTTALTLGAATLFGCWYGAYMLTAWPYAI
ncbi:hypothetical protein OTB20_41735 [Streptomyces sp. H27-H1]|uniref:hypothetical protein n=1 Tax=Streptomyces sp. H27-H1 TaxID=2996461 RepID=UPI0022713F35|nr:hypothetical protein [Streptomyces sp. H27-H1]MCY0932536.1 hypothetical protein [Streptomyces sp. H27-H1]